MIRIGKTEFFVIHNSFNKYVLTFKESKPKVEAYMKKIVEKFGNRVNRSLDFLAVKLLRIILARFRADFYFKDRFGVLSRRDLTDNLNYLLKTKNSCDAADLMEALDNFRFEVAVDVGANIGLVTSFLSARSEIVYAFEPEPRNIVRLREQLELNFARNVEIVDVALSDRIGAAELYVLESYGQHSLGPVETSKPVGSISIKTVTLDDFCASRGIERVDFLKIDVEGFELEVLKGSIRMLRSGCVKLIAFEISKTPLVSLGKRARDVFDFLTDCGYGVFRLNGEKFVGDPDLIFHEDLLASRIANLA